MTAAARPIVLLPACSKEIDDAPFHIVGDKYVRAVALSVKATPLTIPALGPEVDIPRLLSCADGLMLTGSPSNVHPDHYGQTPSPEAEPYDRERDATTLPLIEAALAAGMPMLAICRGFQELNVVLGGSLHARVHEVPGRRDHRRPKHADPDVQYGPNHSVTFVDGGVFAEIFGTQEMTTNSLHWQAIDRLAPGLVAEGWADDGTIEAVRVEAAKSFALGVQWHPEYKSWERPESALLFNAFGDAVRARAARRAAA